MKTYFVPEKSFNEFLTQKADYLPNLKNGKHVVTKRYESCKYSFNTYRVSSPIIKSILFNPREKVDSYEAESNKQQIIFGIKNCDMVSLPIMDFVFMNGAFQDPLYIESRKKTIMFSSDCTDCLDTCFCTLVGNNPYPEKYFDINASPVKGGYILQVATEQGNNILDKSMLQQPSTEQLKEQKANREKIKNKVQSQVAAQGYNIISSPQNAVMNNFESPVWNEATQTCVECGACNFTCPTCHCFLLSEHSNDRYRQWDACQYKGFALVAGGASPRKKLHQRLRNRYVKKFDYFQKHIGLYACTGCGRCILACIGKIDIREVVKKLLTSKCLM